MTICDVCSSFSLDGDGLPTFPTGNHRTKWRYIHHFFRSWSDTEPIKFPFHPDLVSLKSSAGECDLCSLVLCAVEKALEELRNPHPENTQRGKADIPQLPNWELWLTRREYGDGFCVFTNCEDSEDFCFIAAVGVCAREDDPLASVYAGRPIEMDPSGPKTTALLKKWVAQCNEHPNCVTAPPSLPARVIDVGDENNGYSMKLRETNNETGRYTCLSHCWGLVTQFTTTKVSLATHQTEISYHHLPQSFRDAITVTRLLGIRYIWIDSICICQDDGEDWERESAKMTSIYMNSYITIAASGAKDSTVGCFIPRQPPKYIGIPYKSTKQDISGELQAFLLPMRKEALPDLYIDMSDHIEEPDHPLATRAWAVQERVLPHRTLHYGKHQMYFECNEGFKGENGLYIPWRFHSIHLYKHDKYGLAVPEGDNSIEQWYSLLWNFGAREMTRPSDKFPAISGIARLFAERLDDEYVAGLWRGSLIEGLLWQGLGVRRVKEYRAPSWSWASVDGIAATSNWSKQEPLADILDCKVELKGKNVFGEVKSGWIKMRAPLVPLTLDERIDPEGTGVPYDNNPIVRTEKGSPKGVYSRFDFTFTGPMGRENGLAMVESLKGVDIFGLILAKTLPENEEDKVSYRALIVRPTEGDNSTLQRLGFVNFSKKKLGDCSQLDHPDERPVITLI